MKCFTRVVTVRRCLTSALRGPKRFLVEVLLLGRQGFWFCKELNGCWKEAAVEFGNISVWQYIYGFFSLAYLMLSQTKHLNPFGAMASQIYRYTDRPRCIPSKTRYLTTSRKGTDAWFSSLASEGQ